MSQQTDWVEIERLFVEEGYEPVRLVGEFAGKTGMTRLELAQHTADGLWRKKREEFLKALLAKDTEKIGIEGHEDSADQLVATGKAIARELAKSNMTDYDVKRLRSRAEAYRTTVEALNLAVRLARDVRGLRLGQPSTTQEIDATTEVTYFTKVVKREDELQENLGDGTSGP